MFAGTGRLRDGKIREGRCRWGRVGPEPSRLPTLCNAGQTGWLLACGLIRYAMAEHATIWPPRLLATSTPNRRAMTAPPVTELSVRSESVQRLYFLYLADRFDVNRRYQRKLVWSAAEKQRLVDSILRDLPIPLFLVAEIGVGAEASFEVIDGLQRLNAIFSFIENEIPGLGGEYFDLDALADTKSRSYSARARGDAGRKVLGQRPGRLASRGCAVGCCSGGYAYTAGAVAGGSQGPVVNSCLSASSLSMPHLAAVDR